MNTNYFINLIMGNVFKTQTTPSIPSGYYLGLSKTTPTVSGTGVTEPTGGAYARVQIQSFSAPSSGTVKNTSAVSFPESSASWGTITHYVVYDAATGGNLLFYAPLTTSRTADANTVISFGANQISTTLENVSA